MGERASPHGGGNRPHPHQAWHGGQVGRKEQWKKATQRFGYLQLCPATNMRYQMRYILHATTLVIISISKIIIIIIKRRSGINPIPPTVIDRD